MLLWWLERHSDRIVIDAVVTKIVAAWTMGSVVMATVGIEIVNEMNKLVSNGKTCK